MVINTPLIQDVFVNILVLHLLYADTCNGGMIKDNKKKKCINFSNLSLFNLELFLTLII